MGRPGARGSAAQIKQLSGMRGLMAKPDGSIIETPITSNFREGLSVLQYFIRRTARAKVGRHRAENRQLRLPHPPSGRCNPRFGGRGRRLRHLRRLRHESRGAGRRRHRTLRDRILGRVAAQDIVDPATNETLVEAGTMLSEQLVDLIDNSGVDEVKVRTLGLPAKTRYGLCAKYTDATLRAATGQHRRSRRRDAAQSIGEPGTQLTMRTFTSAARLSLRRRPARWKPNPTARRFNSQMRYVANNKGELIVIGRSCEVVIHDDIGRERERHKVPYGATLLVQDGATVKAGTTLATWDPHTAR